MAGLISTCSVVDGKTVVIRRANGEEERLSFSDVCLAALVLRQYVLRILPPEMLPKELMDEAVKSRELSASYTRPTEQEKLFARELVSEHGPLTAVALAQALADARVRTILGC